MERLRNHSEFVGVLRLRNRVTSADVVAHYALLQQKARYSRSLSTSSQGSRLGLAVSKAVGNAVTRNKVKRRFRVLARRYEGYLPQGCDVVLRARPTASAVDFEVLDSQIRKLFEKIAQRSMQQAPREAAHSADLRTDQRKVAAQ